MALRLTSGWWPHGRANGTSLVLHKYTPHPVACARAHTHAHAHCFRLQEEPWGTRVRDLESPEEEVAQEGEGKEGLEGEEKILPALVSLAQAEINPR